jgi:hypothetical protein
VSIIFIHFSNQSFLEEVTMADCSYHPGKDAVGACVNCGKMVCLACRTELQDRVYCHQCANKLFIAKADVQTAPSAPVVQSVSGAWWLLPIFFNWLGGLIAWAVTKSRDPKKAKSMLIWGIIIAVIEIILGGIVTALLVAGILVFSNQ